MFDDTTNSVATINQINQPLAARMRPSSLETFYGQLHLVGKGKALQRCVELGQLYSMIFWGPPGTGKTTLARILARSVDAEMEELSAVTSGVKDIRAVVDRAKMRQVNGVNTILFVDEVHRFSKSQQDAFLPHIESGTFIFIGATTENPSFELNNALLSRVRVHVLKALEEKDLLSILKRAIENEPVNFRIEHQKLLIESANGDARKLLNWLESVLEMSREIKGVKQVDLDSIKMVLGQSLMTFDKRGDYFYDLISALHKSVRGSDPDAALYWFAAMLEGGADPLYIARRVLRMASEDIGNADPRALQIALDAWQVVERLGTPEGELAIAQALVYMAVAPKSNAVYKAFSQAQLLAKKHNNPDVPLYLRNTPTKLMKEMGYSQGYQYPHDHRDGFVSGVNYFPEGLEPEVLYQPVKRGLELSIKEKLDYLRKANKC
ncbi:replication-associated recombination protein A [Thiotrichales bacterium 19S3-7]|nr:replication-associated recombination protein A [Thiotrichales bacterium 19S3-7]MCF6802967.1 replication-associated recombination protein A [Thiotrichales bacterium 19S3-11]